MKARVLSLLAALLVLACSGGDGGSGPSGPAGSISITISPSSVTATQGGSATVTVTLTRSGGFSGAVNVAAENLPAGVTVAGASIAGNATSTTLTVQAGGNAATGTSTITLRATASGLSDATATFSLVVNAAQAGGFTLALNPATLTVQQGTSGQATVNITRAAPFAGAVALSASGLPNGVTASFDPANAAGGTSTLTLTASGNAATGTQTVTVRGTGTGVAEQTVTLSLTVNAGSTGGNAGWPICPGTIVPIWFAVQNGDGPWTRATFSNGAFHFDVTANRVGVAYVTPAGDGGYALSVLYFSAVEVMAQVDRLCDNSGTKTVNGSFAGLSGAQQGAVALGPGYASVFPGGGLNFTIENLPDGPLDLLAARSETSFNGTTVVTAVDKLIIRRNVNAPSGSMLPVLDFGAAEAFDPVMSNVTIDNLNGDVAYLAGWYQTNNGFVNSYFAGGMPTAATVQSWPGIPTNRQEAGDLHALQVNSLRSLTDVDDLRNVLVYFREATDRTIALGPSLNVPTITTVATAPYARFRAQLAPQPEYDRVWGLGYSQIAQGTTSRAVVMIATTDYLGAPATVDIVVPDLSGADGWNSDWGPRPGVQTQWTMNGTDWTAQGGVVESPVTDGGIIRVATRAGTINP